MPKYAKNMQIRDIRKLSKPGVYAIGHVVGLSLRINHSGGAAYIYRYRIDRHARSVTIGDRNTVPLKKAIEKAMQYKLQRLDGKDPFIERKKIKQKLIDEICESKIAKNNNDLFFGEIANKYIDFKKESGSFINNSRAEQTLTSMLINHVYPVIKKRNIKSITACDIRDILAPHWRTEISLSGKLLVLLKGIFDYAIAMNYFDENNPASLTGPLKTLMEPYNQGRIEGGHYASLDYHKIPDFMLDLWKINSIASKAFMFSILTATRSKAVRFATWEQISISQKVWEIPVQNDKTKKFSRMRTIILSDEAIRLLQTISKRDSIIFYSNKLSNFSDAVFGKIIRTLNENLILNNKEPYVDKNTLDKNNKPIQITQHGTARASFKTWAKSDELGNNRKYFDEAVELCLLHDRKDPLKGAYDRSTLEIERRKIMNDWGKFCCSRIPELQD